MNAVLILKHYQQHLSQEIEPWRNELPPYDPPHLSPWIAMSLMQKAIRRDDQGFALAAAASLLTTAPDRLWRRLTITAFEDIGIADIDLIGLTVVAAASKTLRKQIGGEWAVASYLVTRLAISVKCRAADDLAYLAEDSPQLEGQRLDMPFQPLPELLGAIVNAHDVGEQALGLWYAIGTYRCRSERLQERRGDPNSVFDYLSDQGVPDTLVEICRAGFRKTGEILCPMLIPVWQHSRNCNTTVEPDILPPDELINGVPCWVFDTHVREGKQALARFLKTNCETARWIRGNVNGYRRSRFLANLLFRVESGLVDQRLRWPLGDQLKTACDFDILGVTSEQAREASQLLCKDLPILNRERRHVFGSNL